MFGERGWARAADTGWRAARLRRHGGVHSGARRCIARGGGGAIVTGGRRGGRDARSLTGLCRHAAHAFARGRGRCARGGRRGGGVWRERRLGRSGRAIRSARRSLSNSGAAARGTTSYRLCLIIRHRGLLREEWRAHARLASNFINSVVPFRPDVGSPGRKADRP
jgi:hypothetical protein